MANRIKELRKKADMTQEEVGALIGIKKSAVAKYESGDIENIKRASVEKLADFFGVTPAYLLGWSNTETELTSEEFELVNIFDKLNDRGKREAHKRVKELTYFNKYTEEYSEEFMPVAAHGDGVSNEELQADIEKAKKLFADKM
jgi:transcriptional regulator with XRE-family HTH domain